MSTLNKKQIKREIWKKTKGKCAHCGKMVNELDKSIDHFIPKSLGGDYDKRNLMPLCKSCNVNKGCCIVNPFKYYKYAPKKIVWDCIDYKMTLKRNYKQLPKCYAS